MKKKALFLLSAVVLLLVSCDKIEPNDDGQYTTFSGALGQWYDADGVQDHAQRVLLEKYTGVRCNNCPSGDAVIHTAQETYGAVLIPVSIHDSSSFTRPYGSDQRLSTYAGNLWSRTFGISAYPTAICNRMQNDGVMQQFNPAAGVGTAVDAALAQSPVVALALDVQRQGSTFAITANLEFLQNLADPVTLTLMLLEDSVRATQLQPDGHTKDTNYIHNHLLRNVITDPWGAPVDAAGRQGEKRQARFDYVADNQLWTPSNCYIVAFISNKTTRQILNAAIGR